MKEYIKQYEILRSERDYPCLSIINQYQMEYPIFNNNIFNQIEALNDFVFVNKYESEHSWIIARGYNSEIKGIYLTNIGTLDTVTINKRNIGIFLLLIGATEFYSIHNHPSGILESSEGDLVVDAMLKALGDIIEIPCVGSFAVTNEGFCDCSSREIKYYNS